MKARDKQFFGCKHIEYSLAGGDSLVLVVIHLEMPLRPLHGHNVLRERIGGDHESLAVGFDVKSKQFGRMNGGVDSRNARDNFVARFNEGRPVGQGRAYLYI